MIICWEEVKAGLPGEVANRLKSKGSATFPIIHSFIQRTLNCRTALPSLVPRAVISELIRHGPCHKVCVGKSPLNRLLEEDGRCALEVYFSEKG